MTEEILANKIAEILDYSKGHKILKMDMRKIDNCFCDFFVICHGTSNTHVASMADDVEEKIIKESGEKPLHIEGRNHAQWIILDYGNVIVHIFQEEYRNYYQIEDFWADAEITEIVST